MPYTFGTQPSDTVANSRGDVESGIVLSLFDSEGAAVAGTGLLATVTTDAKGLWPYVDATHSVIWAKTLDGSVYPVVSPEAVLEAGAAGASAALSTATSAASAAASASSAATAAAAAVLAAIPAPVNVLSIGSVSTVPSGSPAAANITGVSPAQVLDLVIPLGAQGAPGVQGAPGDPGIGGGVIESPANSGFFVPSVTSNQAAVDTTVSVLMADVTSATRVALGSAFIASAQKGAVSGVASLDSGGKVPSAQLPTVATGVASVNTRSGAVVLTASDVGLGSVNNTTDAAKPVSTLQAAADAVVAGSVTAEAATRLAADNAESATARAAELVTHDFTIGGPLVVLAGTRRVYNDTGRTLTIIAVRVSVVSAPTGAALIFDVTKSGTSIYTTQANRPSIAVSGVTALGGVPDLTWAVGEFLCVDVDQVGSTVAGSDATVTVTAR